MDLALALGFACVVIGLMVAGFALFGTILLRAFQSRTDYNREIETLAQKFGLRRGATVNAGFEIEGKLPGADVKMRTWSRPRRPRHERSPITFGKREHAELTVQFRLPVPESLVVWPVELGKRHAGDRLDLGLPGYMEETYGLAFQAEDMEKAREILSRKPVRKLLSFLLTQGHELQWRGRLLQWQSTTPITELEKVDTFLRVLVEGVESISENFREGRDEQASPEGSDQELDAAQPMPAGQESPK